MKTSRAVQLLLLLLGLLVIKAAIFHIDGRPAFFMGDSMSYLFTASTRWIPDDRSFVYGFLLRKVAFKPHSIVNMVIFQSFISGISAWLLSVYLIRYFRVSFWIAAIFAVFCALEPLQLVSERYVMTEAVATFLFCLYFGCALEYICRGRLVWMLLAQAIGVGLLTIRMSFLPAVLVCSVLIGLLSPQAVAVWKSLRPRLRMRKATSAFEFGTLRLALLPLLAGVLLSQGLLYSYRHWYGHLDKKSPAYSYADGYFLAGFWAPIIKPIDYPVPERRQAIFTNLAGDLTNPNLRYVQRWDANGLCDRIIHQFQSPNGTIDVVHANEMAKRVAIHAAERDPIGLAKLVLFNFRGYFQNSFLEECTAKDEGMDADDAHLKSDLQKYYRFSSKTLNEATPTKEWHLDALPWFQFQLLFLALSPSILVCCKPIFRPRIIFCVVMSLFFLIGAIVTVERPTPRYLTTSAWLVLLTLGSMATIFRKRPAIAEEPVLAGSSSKETSPEMPIAHPNAGKPTVGLCLLVWNEVEGCRYDVPKLLLDQFDEVFAVDGGSKDGTIEYLESQGVRVVRQALRGYNRAYISAYENSSADALIFYHPKGSIDPKYTLDFRQHFDTGADLVVASRNMPGSRNEEDTKFLKPRKWFVDGLALLTGLLWWREGTYVRDVLHGFRGMRRDAFWRMEPLPEGLSMDLQMVARSYRLRSKRAEFPVEEWPRLAGDTHFKALPTGYALLKYLWLELRRTAVPASSPAQSLTGKWTPS